MKKLIDLGYWYARVYVDIEIKKDLAGLFKTEGGFPIDIGAVTLTSKDGKRNLVMDTYYTDFCNDKELAGEIFTFNSRLEFNKEIFPEEDGYNYNLTADDLNSCTGEFYCNVDPEYMGEPEMTWVMFRDNSSVKTIKLKLD